MLLDYVKNFANGKGTYGVGFLMMLYGATGFALGHIDYDAAVRQIMEGLGFVFLRRALK